MIGFERGFDECDALTQVCRVWGRLRRRRHWTYDARGERRRLAPDELAAVDARVAADGHGADQYPNSNGITRHALPVLDERGRLAGVLAIARTGPRQKSDVTALRRVAQPTAIGKNRAP